MVTIAPHACYSPQQDAIYGVGRRLHNSTVKGIRCTVCGVPSCDKLVRMRANPEGIKSNGGTPLRAGAWTCLGVA